MWGRVGKKKIKMCGEGPMKVSSWTPEKSSLPPFGPLKKNSPPPQTNPKIFHPYPHKQAATPPGKNDSSLILVSK